MIIKTKVEDLQIGDKLDGIKVFDVFYRTNTLRAITPGIKSKGIVLVMFEDYRLQAYPVGVSVTIEREDAPQRSG